MKLRRSTFSATFFLACLAAMELEGVVLEEIYHLSLRSTEGHDGPNHDRQDAYGRGYKY